MQHDWLLESIDVVEDAAIEARDALAAVIQHLDAARSGCLSAIPLVDVVDQLIESGGKDLRSSAGEALQRYERAVLLFRANLVKHMTEDEGLTIAEAARHLRISRQRASRLLQTANEGPTSSV